MNCSSSNAAAVLVVEDEPLVRIYLSDVLGQSGFDVISATNGEDPLVLAKSKDVCAVVTMSPCPAPSTGSSSPGA